MHFRQINVIHHHTQICTLNLIELIFMPHLTRIFAVDIKYMNEWYNICKTCEYIRIENNSRFFMSKVVTPLCHHVN